MGELINFDNYRQFNCNSSIATTIGQQNRCNIENLQSKEAQKKYKLPALPTTGAFLSFALLSNIFCDVPPVQRMPFRIKELLFDWIWKQS